MDGAITLTLTNLDISENAALKCRMHENRTFIFDEHRHRSLHSTYNFPLRPQRWSHDMRDALRRVVSQAQTQAVKVTLSLGTVLRFY